jgi:hypothetical protein
MRFRMSRIRRPVPKEGNGRDSGGRVIIDNKLFNRFTWLISKDRSKCLYRAELSETSKSIDLIDCRRGVKHILPNFRYEHQKQIQARHLSSLHKTMIIAEQGRCRDASLTIYGG